MRRRSFVAALPLAAVARTAFTQTATPKRADTPALDGAFKRIGGWLSYDDLRSHHSVWTQPLVTTYRGVEVYAIGENTQGLATLQMLNILENIDPRSMGFQSAASIHTQVEAKRLSYEDRARYRADGIALAY